MQDSSFGLHVEVPDYIRRNDYRLVMSKRELDGVLEECSKVEFVSLDTETSGLDKFTDFFAGFSVSWAESKAVYIPVSHVAGPNADLEQVKEFLTALKDLGKPLVYHNAAFDISRIRRWLGLDFKFENYHDTQSMCFRIDPNLTTKLKVRTELYLGYKPLTLEDLFGKNIPQFQTLDVNDALWYAAADADNTLRLFYKLRHMVESKFHLGYQIDLSLIPVVEKQNWSGVLLRVKYIEACKLKLGKIIEEAKTEISAVAGWEVNPNSVAHIQKLLYEQLDLPILRKSKVNKAPSTDKKTLAQLEALHPVARMITNVKSFVKLRGYCNTLLEAARIVPGEEWLWEQHGLKRIVASYMIFHVPTGRFACEAPNLQQIPKKKDKPGWEEVPTIRSAFRPRPGYHFIEADYAAVEVRVFAGEAKVESFLTAFSNGGDPHRAAYSQMKRKAPEDVTPDERSTGKVINFGLFYGQTAAGLSETLSISVQEAEELYDDYFRAIPEAKVWIEKTHREAKQLGGVWTKFGLFRPLPELNSPDHFTREFGKRSAVNTIVQGSAADVLKLALIRLDKLWAEGKWSEDQAHLVFTTHDSVLFEVKDDTQIDVFLADIKQAMELKVVGWPDMLVDVTTGSDYGSLHSLELKDENTSIYEAPVVQVPVVVASPEIEEVGDKGASSSAAVVLIPAGPFTADRAAQLSGVLRGYKDGEYSNGNGNGSNGFRSLRVELRGKLIELGSYHWDDGLSRKVMGIGFSELLPAAPLKFSFR